MPSKKWLITGASGLLGNKFCARLMAQNQHVIGVRNHHPLTQDVTQEIAKNLFNFAEIKSILQSNSPDFVVHAAGLINMKLQSNPNKSQLL